MKAIIKGFILIFIFTSCQKRDSQVNINNLRCEYKVNPIGVDISEPRFSWELASIQRGAKHFCSIIALMKLVFSQFRDLSYL